MESSLLLAITANVYATDGEGDIHCSTCIAVKQLNMS